MTGPPGAGKSSVSAALADRFDPSALVAGDEFFGFLRRGSVPPWQPAAGRQNTVVTEAAAAAAGRFCGFGWVVYDGVVGPWFLPTFTRGSGLDQLHYVVLLPPLDTCLERVRVRTGHAFTDAAVTRDMHRQFADADIASRHLLTDGDPDVDTLVTRIHRGIADGSFVQPT